MQRSDGTWEIYDDYVLDFALDRIHAGEAVALVTLVAIEGSSPRPLGAQMAVSRSGRWVGYLSGGCIERAIVAEALEAIAAGVNRRVRYGRGSKYLDIELPCGSAVELVFDVGRHAKDIASIDAQLQRRQPAMMTVPGCAAGAAETLRVYQPRRRLLVIGVGPATVSLVHLGLSTGWEVKLYSPDRPTIKALRSTGAEIVPLTGVNSEPALQADMRTAIVFMFHDHRWESRLLPAALQTDAFYIGAMGSRRTHAVRLDLLIRQGFAPDQLSKIRGPAGMFSGVKNAHDIALSILAEIVHCEAKEKAGRTGS